MIFLYALGVLGAILYIWLWRKTFKLFYNDFRDDWHVGHLLSGIIIASFCCVFAGWEGWADELSRSDKGHFINHAARRLGASLAGEGKVERCRRKEESLRVREERVKQLEAELGIGQGEEV